MSDSTQPPNSVREKGGFYHSLMRPSDTSEGGLEALIFDEMWDYKRYFGKSSCAGQELLDCECATVRRFLQLDDHGLTSIAEQQRCELCAAVRDDGCLSWKPEVD